ncbi:MAG: hypothetical protein A3A98_04075 [Candidatus Staskawiczbacteria bacterium RIFCSPLOWO2_01_FULL_40_39]|uniref:HTH deoR-type domain-containing protein n=1 Tax=Candidatus Staskawiczbacteria bacterium RIFCSPHIGHO2_01_FULL_39_25 TaxID=1802202 RepID=A0A1G2HQG9_9BACT|nr:MAG: hypothetical protein A2730_03290 [Candidatus Staskawiczbacteria bacterium RIFCSPHIGHO2_01_FULL_39_25]OGZ73945.1 MAG: hypothetical protein A3A98_04075 [Candidatus Staskawiczbacteria bacterium RIFCSPLOWO2_01_FULL_40_39]OGZ76562.1 MAG: hypothetical protein A3I87_01720 [Candidatus Staskawiczbacteria bacterium RIFCSPLOWO2_02_FULL_39_8]
MEDNFVKITNAVYKLLDFFPDSDPLKNKAKEKALAILDNLTLISNNHGWVSLQKEKASAQLLDDIGMLENYLAIGKHQGWIGHINFLIIVKEYRQIMNEISPPKGSLRRNIQIASAIAKDVPEVLNNAPKSIEIKDDASGYSERQTKILKILSEREKAQVSDFIKELPDITKRTIRRDLDDLLKRGKVIRIGEWNQVFYKTR